MERAASGPPFYVQSQSAPTRWGATRHAVDSRRTAAGCRRARVFASPGAATCGSPARCPVRAPARHRRHHTPRRCSSWPGRHGLPRLGLRGSRRSLDRSGFLVHRFEDDLPTNRADVARPNSVAGLARDRRSASSPRRRVGPRGGQEGPGHRITLQVDVTYERAPNRRRRQGTTTYRRLFRSPAQPACAANRSTMFPSGSRTVA